MWKNKWLTERYKEHIEYCKINWLVSVTYNSFVFRMNKCWYSLDRAIQTWRNPFRWWIRKPNEEIEILYKLHIKVSEERWVNPLSKWWIIARYRLFDNVRDIVSIRKKQFK